MLETAKKILYKIVWKDDTVVKIIKAYILEDELHLFKVETEDGRIMMIGKCAIIKVVPVIFIHTVEN